MVDGGLTLLTRLMETCGKASNQSHTQNTGTDEDTAIFGPHTQHCQMLLLALPKNQYGCTGRLGTCRHAHFPSKQAFFNEHYQKFHQPEAVVTFHFRREPAHALTGGGGGGNVCVRTLKRKEGGFFLCPFCGCSRLGVLNFETHAKVCGGGGAGKAVMGGSGHVGVNAGVNVGEKEKEKEKERKEG